MALQGESNRVSLRISKETVWGETPATPVMAKLPFTSDSLVHNKRTKQSDVLRSDRMKDAQVQVGVDAQGDINFEMRFLDFEAILEVALANTFTAATFTGAGGNLDFAASGGGVQVITAPASTWNNYVVGAWVRIKGANANNNGVFKITAKDSTTLTVNNSAGTLQADADGAQVIQKTMRNGTSKQSLLIEKQWEDLTNVYMNFRGMRVAGLSLNIQTESIITGTVRFMGKQGFTAAATVSGSLTNPSANDSMTASTNVGNIEEGGAALTTAIKSITMDLNNNVRALAAVGNVAAIGINMGSIALTGRVEAYFEDLTLMAKVINHTSSSLVFRMTDPAGNVLVWTLAQLKFSGNPPTPGIDQDVMLPLDYSCERQPTDSYMIQVDALAA